LTLKVNILCIEAKVNIDFEANGKAVMKCWLRGLYKTVWFCRRDWKSLHMMRPIFLYISKARKSARLSAEPQPH